MKTTLLAVLTTLCLAVPTIWAKERKAICVLTTGEARGNVTLTQPEEGGPVTIGGVIERLQPNKEHGFHVHEKGDLSSGCTSAAGHFNPLQKHHGGPDDVERHVGDLGNIHADSNGVATFTIVDSQVSLIGEHSVLGRAIVVHADKDDFGKGGFPDSLTTGHAGSRVGCGVIGIMEPSNIPWMPSGSPTIHPTMSYTFAILVVLTHIFIN